jgi:hypothetical protein
MDLDAIYLHTTTMFISTNRQKIAQRAQVHSSTKAITPMAAACPGLGRGVLSLARLITDWHEQGRWGNDARRIGYQHKTTDLDAISRPLIHAECASM